YTYTGGVHANVAKRQVRIFGNTGRHQEKRGRGNISRHINGASRQFASTGDTGSRTVAVNVVTETLQHALGMIPGWRRLGHRGNTLSVESRQQQAGFHLGTGHRHFVMNARECMSTPNLQRRPTTFTSVD